GFGRGVELAERFIAPDSLDLFPPFTDGNGFERQSADILTNEVDREIKRFAMLFFEGDGGEAQPGLEDRLRERFRADWLGARVLLLEALEVAPVVEDLEFDLILSGTEQIGAKSRAAADHLPELDVGVNRLREDEVDDFGNVDAGIKHVDRNRDG